MEMTAFNFIINFFRRGVVHILKRDLFCCIKMGGRRERTAKKSQEQDQISPSLFYPVPKMNPVVEHALNFRRWI